MQNRYDLYNDEQNIDSLFLSSFDIDAYFSTYNSCCILNHSSVAKYLSIHVCRREVSLKRNVFLSERNSTFHRISNSIYLKLTQLSASQDKQLMSIWQALTLLSQKIMYRATTQICSIKLMSSCPSAMTVVFDFFLF